MDEQRRKLLNTKPRDSAEEEDEDEEEWSEDSSNDSYYSEDSDSSVPEWESSIDESTGELLFIDCHPFVTQNNIDNKIIKEVPEPFSKNQIRRSTRGKFLRLIRRRESKRHSRRYQKSQENPETSTFKVKFQDSQEGEEKEVLLKINQENYNKKGANLSESLLGISTSTLSDGNRVMIAGFLPDSLAKYEKSIKIGDWLKSVNNVEVTYQNLNQVLQQIAPTSKEVLLKLQRVAGVEVTKDPPINELNCQSKFVRQLIETNREHEEFLIETLSKLPIGILYLNPEKLTENGPEFEDIVYCYPKLKSVLCNCRGIFLTLNQLIDDITQTKPKVSSILFKDKLSHIVYKKFDKKLLLLMLPANCATIKEAILITIELVRMLEFLYETIDACFTSNQKKLNNFFERFFIRMLNNGWTTSQNFVELQNISTRSSRKNSVQFEQVLPVASMLNLPNEALMQIDDALTELEASDYREWNEEPLDCQRLFTILGSALYHDGYLLASHFIYEDLIDVHSFCRQQGLLYLSKTEPIKTLVLWRECFPSSCHKIKTNQVPEGKRYILVVGSAKDLLAVIMEAGGCTEPPEDNMGPDAFYVEEAQATLAHIQELGLSELADRWICMNPGPQVTLPPSKRKSDFFNVSKTTKKAEVTSILKRRNSDQNLGHSSSVFSLDDTSNLSDTNSEISDRRNEDDETDEEISNSSFDISELRQTLLSETEFMQPQQLTAGTENVLFHYLQVDTVEGTLLCPPDCRVQSQTLNLILNNFRKCCHKIHDLFQNTLRFKNMPAQDMAKSVMNKSLIAIKEHGIMFECPFLDDQDKRSKIRYWVVGRLFYMPHPTEVYVCYQDTIPQNIVELAFKIDLSTMS